MFNFSPLKWRMTAISQTHILFCLTIVLGVIFVLPNTASAFNVVSQSATQLTEDTFLFQITYRLNFGKRDSQVPILSKRTSIETAKSQHLKYSLVSSEGNPVGYGTATSLVLSDAAIVDGRYYTYDGEPEMFTLVSIFNAPKNLIDSGEEIALKVDRLPFTLIRSDSSSLTLVPEVFIESYKTDFIEL